MVATETKPLETCQRVLIWLCVCPSDENTCKWLKLFHIFATTVTITTVVSGMIASIVYFMEFSSTNAEESLYAMFQIFGNLLLENAIIVGFVYRTQISETFRLLSDICSSSKNLCLK